MEERARGPSVAHVGDDRVPGVRAPVARWIVGGVEEALVLRGAPAPAQAGEGPEPALVLEQRGIDRVHVLEERPLELPVPGELHRAPELDAPVAGRLGQQ